MYLFYENFEIDFQLKRSYIQVCESFVDVFKQFFLNFLLQAGYVFMGADRPQRSVGQNAQFVDDSPKPRVAVTYTWGVIAPAASRSHLDLDQQLFLLHRAGSTLKCH